MSKTPNIVKLKEQAKALEKKHREVLATIRKSEKEEKDKIYLAVGKGMEKLFKKDQQLNDTAGTLSLCRKYFPFDSVLKETEEPSVN